MDSPHQHIMEYGNNSTTLAWKIFPEQNNCSASQILSYPPCQWDNAYNITTDDMKATLSSESLHQITGELTDFRISSQPTLECPELSNTVRINGKYHLLFHHYI